MQTNTQNTPAPIPPQDFPLATVRIVKNRTSGLRFAQIAPKSGQPAYNVPLELLSVAAGSALWMRQIRFKCKSCRTVIAANSTDGGEYCQTCFDAAGEENERSDNGEASQ